MEKIIGLGLVLVYAVWFFTSSAINSSVKDDLSEEFVIDNHIPIGKNLTQKQIHDTIKSTGEEKGWIMTEFKHNTLIAEKIAENNTVSVTIKFNKSSFYVSPIDTALSNDLKSVLSI